jgi:hypothetical protein
MWFYECSGTKRLWVFHYFYGWYSRYSSLYLICQKFEALEKLKEFWAEANKQLSKYIKVIWWDWGGEYLFEDFKDYLLANEIVSQLNAPWIP